MPKISDRHALLRQWSILRAIPRRAPGITASALTESLRKEGTRVVKRTIERDLIVLEQVFGIRCNDVSIPYGWYWPANQNSEFVGLDVADALSLTLVEDLLAKLLPAQVLEVLQPKFDQAHRTLRSATKNRFAAWKDCVRYVSPHLCLEPPVLQPGILAAVQMALLDKCQVDIRYQIPGEPAPKELSLHPLALIQAGAVTYLAATAFEYRDVRLYALHRVRSVTNTTIAALSPSGFSVSQLLNRGSILFGSGHTIRLEAHISDRLALQLKETPLSQDMVLTRRGTSRTRLSASVKDTWQLLFWILSQNADITVLRPCALRKQVTAALQAAIANYV